MCKLQDLQRRAEDRHPNRSFLGLNENDCAVLRVDFADTEDLEMFFLGLIGLPEMKGLATKAIGKTLLAWERN